MAEYIKTLFAVEETEGQGLVEYALILALIAIVVAASLTALQVGLDSVFGTITGAL